MITTHQQYCRDYWQKNKDELSAKRRAKYAENAEYRKKHNESSKALQAKYREIKKTSPQINLSRMASQAKSREGGDITTSFLMNMWIEQEGKCALTGLEMCWGHGVVSAMNVSIDRIDQSRGYFKDNVRLVCWCVNSFRQKMSDKQLLEIATALVNNLQAKQSSHEVIAKITGNPLETRAFL